MKQLDKSGSAPMFNIHDMIRPEIRARISEDINITPVFLVKYYLHSHYLGVLAGQVVRECSDSSLK